VVIPHRRRRDLLERALHHLQGERVLVVDDTDDGLDLVVPKVRLGGGSGFAVAANAGLDAVRTRWAVLLNDDAFPQDDCLARLARVGGLCGPVLVGPRGVESTGLDVRSWGRVAQRTDVPGVDRPVDALSGCCLHLPASARFDPRYTHGLEDVELCRRIGPSLGGARLVANARCWHEGGGTVHRASREAQRHAVSGQLRLVPPGWRDLAILALAAAQVAREGGFDRLGGAWDGWKDARRG